MLNIEVVKAVKKTALASLLALLALSPPSQAAEIVDGFKNPPKSCALQTWWHWIDDCVTREGISHDLAAMSGAGISTAFVFSPKTWGMRPIVETIKR
jgi:hypothetical protein